MLYTVGMMYVICACICVCDDLMKCGYDITQLVEAWLGAGATPHALMHSYIDYLIEIDQCTNTGECQYCM